jgi:hypothetical protein
VSVPGKIRRIQADPHIDGLEEFCRHSRAECTVRAAEIQLVENLVDRIDAAVAARDYTLAQQLVGEWAAAYWSVKSTSDQEALKTLAVAEILSKLKEKDPRE